MKNRSLGCRECCVEWVVVSSKFQVFLVPNYRDLRFGRKVVIGEEGGQARRLLCKFWIFANKLPDLILQKTCNSFTIWLGLPRGVNVAKKGVSLDPLIIYAR